MYMKNLAKKIPAFIGEKKQLFKNQESQQNPAIIAWGNCRSYVAKWFDLNKYVVQKNKITQSPAKKNTKLTEFLRYSCKIAGLSWRNRQSDNPRHIHEAELWREAERERGRSGIQRRIIPQKNWQSYELIALREQEHHQANQSRTKVNEVIH